MVGYNIYTQLVELINIISRLWQNYSEVFQTNKAYIRNMYNYGHITALHCYKTLFRTKGLNLVLSLVTSILISMTSRSSLQRRPYVHFYFSMLFNPETAYKLLSNYT